MRIYPNSINEIEGKKVSMARRDDKDVLIAGLLA